ncbi:MAG: serine/threonine protein kinase [Burkholderiales bacterium]
MADEPGASAGAPYAGLTPEVVLDALEGIGLACDGRLMALNSYENRVFQVGIDQSAPLVAKFYRPARWDDAQILEEHAFALALAAAEVPMVPPLSIDGMTLFTHANFRFAVFERRGGRTPELEDADVLAWLGRFLARLHMVGAMTPFEHRPALDAQTFGCESRDWLIDHAAVPADLVPAWRAAIDMALELVQRCYERAGRITLLRCHGDCHPGNLLWTDAGPHFVDLDDARMAPAMQDLWMLLPGGEGAAAALGHLIGGYEEMRDFDDAELHLIEALRTLRLIHHAAWLARRWDDPAFPAAFPWFASQRYWQDRILELKEQAALMQEAPLRPQRPR